MARREPRWVKLFLRELSRTGNVRISAEGAGVDFSTAYQRRKRHGEFAEAWEEALGVFAACSAQGEGALQGAPSTIPSSGNGAPPSAGIPPAPSHRRSLEAGSARAGEELIVRPDGKVIKGSAARWGKRAEERFLLELTVSGSVKLAAREAGFSTQALYKRRLKDKHFAASWAAALETGKARVQAYLVEAATRTFDPDELPIGDEREIPKVSIGEAINIARMKGPGDARAPSGTGRTGWQNEEGGQFLSDEDYREAGERVVARLMRLKEKIEQEERDSGRCRSCGQVLPDAAEA